MQKRVFVLVVCLFMMGLILSCGSNGNNVDDLFHYAQTRKNDLKLSVYMTAHDVKNHLSDEMGRREAVSVMRANGITKAYVSGFRSGLSLDEDLLKTVRDFLLENNFEVAGAIATLPGGEYGVKQDGPLGWFNWQNEKTQKDLEVQIRKLARVFDTFILDDFFCTSDTSMESKAAKGDQRWSTYRMDLLTDVAKRCVIDPAKEENPDITVIIKYPQWYDRFHLFGYDVPRQTAQFDGIWIGTETRGQYRQRYGFVQPYEGFVNYRWISTFGGEKTGGAWFDTGDCEAIDYIEQAYQTVLAGANEIVHFNYSRFLAGFDGYHVMRRQIDKLADLAAEVKVNPVSGVMGYKPANSDAGGDLYIMDYLGMFGIPLVPCSQFPTDASVVFLPTQAATDADIADKIDALIAKKATIILTSGFLANAKDGKRIAELAGIKWPVKVNHVKAAYVYEGKKRTPVEFSLDLEAKIGTTTASALLSATTKRATVPFLTVNTTNGAKIYTLNTHTFDQKDFDAVGEVLLCPRQLGLLELPESWANTIRAAFNEPLGLDLTAPTRVSLQPLGTNGWFIHNYNQEAVQMTLNLAKAEPVKLVDGFSGNTIELQGHSLVKELAPRSRLWLKKTN